MAKLIYTKGLPGSGKSYWAATYQSVTPGCVIVCKDDLREMLHGGKWSKQNEEFVLRVRDYVISEALARGNDVVVADTNWEPKHSAKFSEIAANFGAEVVCKDFSDTPLATCLEQNRTPERVLRGRAVPEKVIRQMWSRYVAKPVPAPPYDPVLPDCYICDIDGTIATRKEGSRGWFEEDKVYLDDVRENVADIVKSRCYSGKKIIFMSGRTEACRAETTRWLTEKAMFCAPVALLMRKEGDTRPDHIVKRELFDANIAGKYNVLGVFDDRAAVIRECWKPLGLTVFRVGVIDEDEF